MQYTFTKYNISELKHYKGWIKTIIEYFDKIQYLIDTKYKNSTFQIFSTKEKYGRFDITWCGGEDELQNLAMELESKTEETCDECGAKGELRTDIGWFRTLCEEHYKHALDVKKYAYESGLIS